MSGGYVLPRRCHAAGASRRLTASRRTLGARCMYLSVVPSDMCPASSWIAFAGAPDERAFGSGRWVLTVSILGSSMAFVDGTVVNVALPAIQSSLGASLGQIQWVVESYALFLAALLLGLAETLLIGYANIPLPRDALAFIAMIGVLMWRSEGLLGSSR